VTLAMCGCCLTDCNLSNRKELVLVPVHVVLELLGVTLSPTKRHHPHQNLPTQEIRSKARIAEGRLVTAATVGPVTRPGNILAYRWPFLGPLVRLWQRRSAVAARPADADPPGSLRRVRALRRRASLVFGRGVGHLAHELRRRDLALVPELSQHAPPRMSPTARKGISST
jgi:hypothetical protein